MTFWTEMSGHAWTVWPHVRGRFRPPIPPVSSRWSTELTDPIVGPIQLSGRIHHVEGARGIVVIVHGMGGDADRAYCALGAAAARRAGLSSLRLNLRGADGSGQDLYHIGLVDDVEAALAHPDLARYERRYALGFSLGGHVVLRTAALARAGRLTAVAAVCPPLDLVAGCAHIDHPARWAYRRHLLSGVKLLYREVAARRPMPEPVEAILAIRTVRNWDDRVIAPRFGFANADDYYARVGVGPLLADLATPSLFVGSESDPIIPSGSLRPVLARASRALEVRWYARGGHVGFPSEADLMEETMRWLAEH